MDCFSKVPQSECRVFAGCDHKSLQCNVNLSALLTNQKCVYLSWVRGTVGQFIIMTAQLLDTLTGAGVPDGGQSVPASCVEY